MAAKACIIQPIICGGVIKILCHRTKNPTTRLLLEPWQRLGVAALARTLELLPKSDAHYSEYVQDFKDMSAALLKVQREDVFGM